MVYTIRKSIEVMNYDVHCTVAYDPMEDEQKFPVLLDPEWRNIISKQFNIQFNEQNQQYLLARVTKIPSENTDTEWCSNIGIQDWVNLNGRNIRIVGSFRVTLEETYKQQLWTASIECLSAMVDIHKGEIPQWK